MPATLHLCSRLARACAHRRFLVRVRRVLQELRRWPDSNSFAPNLLVIHGCAPSGSTPYSMVVGATCATGYSPITSSWQDCYGAAIALGLTGDAIGYVAYLATGAGTSNEPSGCYRAGDNNRVHFNPGMGDGAQLRDNDRIICRSTPRTTRMCQLSSLLGTSSMCTGDIAAASGVSL